MEGKESGEMEGKESGEHGCEKAGLGKGERSRSALALRLQQ